MEAEQRDREAAVSEGVDIAVSLAVVELRHIETSSRGRPLDQQERTVLMELGGFLAKIEHYRAQLVMALLARKGRDSLSRDDLRAVVEKITGKLPPRPLLEQYRAGKVQ